MDKPPQNLESKIIIQGIHFQLTDAIKSAAFDRFGRILDRHERIIRINLNIHQDQTMGNAHHYALTAQVEISGPDLIANTDGQDPYIALDELADKVERLLRQRSDHRKDKRNHPHSIELDAQIPKAD